MPIVSIEQIQAAQDVREEFVDVPEWGADAQVKVRGLTKAAQQNLRRLCTVVKPAAPGQKPEEVFDQEKFDTAIVIAGVVEPALSEEHIPLLKEKSAGVVDRIAMAVMRVSGLTAEAVKEAEKSPS